MIRHLTILAAQLMAMLAVLFFIEAEAWLTEGYGIHPVGAGFIAALLLFAPHLIPKEYTE